MKLLWILSLLLLIATSALAQSELDEEINIGGFIEGEEPIVSYSPGKVMANFGGITQGLCTVENVEDPDSYELKVYRVKSGTYELLSDQAEFNLELQSAEDLKDSIVCRAEKDGLNWETPIVFEYKEMGVSSAEPTLAVRTHRPNSKVTALFCEVKPKPSMPRRFRFRWIAPTGRMIANGPLAVVQSEQLEQNGAHGYICESYDMLTRKTYRVGLQYKLALAPTQGRTATTQRLNIIPSPPAPDYDIRFELRCALEPISEVDSVAYRWTKNKRPLPTVSDTHVIENFGDNDLGLYECSAAFQLLNGYKGQLFARLRIGEEEDADENHPHPSNIDRLEVVPKFADKKERTSHEIHCTLASTSISASEITWYFQGRNSPIMERLALSTNGWVRSDIGLSSFIKKSSLSTADTGMYICKIDGTELIDRSEVRVQRHGHFTLSREGDEVKARVDITPPVQTIRRGEDARFKCTASNSDRSLFQGMITADSTMGRVSTKKLAPDMIEVIVSGVPQDGATVNCRASDAVASARIQVTNECQSNERRCRDGTCLASGRFCDGRRDCRDGSDEENCRDCDPVIRACQPNRNGPPTRQTYNVNWECDGENDCGNGYDEEGCPQPQVGTCNRDTSFSCRDGRKTIFNAYVCDGTADCPGNDDEQDCTAPLIVDRPQGTYQSQPGETVRMTCTVTGKPLPRVIWRLNWGCLPGQNQGESQTRYLSEVPNSRFNVTSIVENCQSPSPRVISTLTISNVNMGDSGIYNCEAIGGSQRSMSQDYHLLFP